MKQSKEAQDFENQAKAAHRKSVTPNRVLEDGKMQGPLSESQTSLNKAIWHIRRAGSGGSHKAAEHYAEAAEKAAPHSGTPLPKR